MKNQSKIKGNENINLQGLKNSNVSLGNNPSQNKSSNKIWIIIPIIIASVALVVQILVGWEQLIPWFNAK